MRMAIFFLILNCSLVFLRHVFAQRLVMQMDGLRSVPRISDYPDAILIDSFEFVGVNNQSFNDMPALRDFTVVDSSTSNAGPVVLNSMIESREIPKLEVFLVEQFNDREIETETWKFEHLFVRRFERRHDGSRVYSFAYESLKYCVNLIGVSGDIEVNSCVEWNGEGEFSLASALAPGDLNENGRIDIVDVNQLVEAIAANENLPGIPEN